MIVPVDETFQMFSELRAEYGLYHERIRENRRFYDLDFEPEVLSAGARARGFKAVIPRTARRTIDEATDHVLTVPHVSVPVRPTDSDLVTQEYIAEKKRKAITAWWRQVTQRYNPIGDGRKWLFIDGMIAIRHSIRWDMVPDKEDKDYRAKLKRLGRNEFMWEDRVLNNEWVYVDPSDHRNPDYAFVAYSMMREAAEKKFPKGEDYKPGVIGQEWRSGSRYSKVNYMEYWSAPTWNDDGTWEPGEFRQFIESDCVHDDINPYPYVPIAVEDSGYGLIHEGIDIDKKFVGLNDHSQSTFVAQARQWSSMEAVTELTAFNPIITRNMSDEALEKLVVGPGEMWQLDGNPATDPDAEIVELQKWPDIPVSVLQMINLTEKEVNGATKMEMLGGIAQKGVDTASEADQNVRNASAKLSGPVNGLERLAAKLTRWFLMDIELVLEAPVTLFNSGANEQADITLSPREINGYYECTVEMSTTDEEALSLTKARFWGEMYRVLPFLSAWTAMERGGMTDDPLAEMLRRAGEDVYLSPEFAQIRIATGAESFGEFSAYLAQMVQNQKGGGGTGGGGANSAEGLVTQDTINAPVSPVAPAAIQDTTALTQAASAIRAGRTVGTQPNG